MKKEQLNPIDQLFDENNFDNIFLEDENHKKVEFKQIGLIPLDERVFAVLQPVKNVFDLAEDEALVFEIVEDKNPDESYIELCQDEEIIDKVFAELNDLLIKENKE